MHRPWVERDSSPAQPADGQRRRWLSAALAWPLAATLPGLGGCTRTPRRIALLAGLTGSASDLGVAARDAVNLAWSDAHDGPATELLVFDDGQRPDRIEDVAARIASSQAKVVIGPMTSSIAEVWIPQGERLGLVTISPTASSDDFSGRDDLFFRVCPTTSADTRRAVDFAIHTRGWHRFLILRDDSNAAYARSWTDSFIAFARQAGVIIDSVLSYNSTTTTNNDKLRLIDSALNGQPEVLVIVANSRDTAYIAQIIATRPARPALMATEWAGTEELIIAGGRAVEDLILTQFFDQSSSSPAYLAFLDRFIQRYGRQPGYTEVASYDAMNVILNAFRRQQTREPLKQTLLRVRRFEGLQNPIVFDDYGDCDRPLAVTQVRNGRFVVIG